MLKEKAAVLSADAMGDERFAGAMSIAAQGTRSIMCVPLLHGNDLLGLIHLDSRAAIDAFTEKDLLILTSIARQAALSIANARMAKRIEEQDVRRDRLSRYFAEGVIADILAGNESMRLGGHSHLITLLFTDIRGFTSMMERLPALAERWVADKRPFATEGSTLTTGIGINTGTAIGDAVNLTARVQGVAEGGQVLITQSTHELVAPLVTATSLEPVHLKGKSALIPIFHVTGLR